MNIKNLDPNKTRINEKSYNNILIYHIWSITVKDLSYTKINSANPLSLIINKITRYIEENNGNRYLMLLSVKESEDTLKKYEELWSKIRDLVRSITSNLDSYDEKYIKIKINLDDDLPLKNP